MILPWYDKNLVVYIWFWYWVKCSFYANFPQNTLQMIICFLFCFTCKVSIWGAWCELKVWPIFCFSSQTTTTKHSACSAGFEIDTKIGVYNAYLTDWTQKYWWYLKFSLIIIFTMHPVWFQSPILKMCSSNHAQTYLVNNSSFMPLLLCHFCNINFWITELYFMILFYWTVDGLM